MLALSVALSAFPVLSAREGQVFDRTCAGSTRAVLLVSWLGAAAVAALAFGLVAYLLNDGDLRAALSWLRQVTRRVPDEALYLRARCYSSPPSPGGRAAEPVVPTASGSSPVTACPFP